MSAERPTRDFTATTFVVRDDHTLLLWHNKIQAWLPPGGHIDEDELPEEAALREVREETGLAVELLGTSGKLGSVDVLLRPECILLEDIDEGHQHIDLIYFATVDDGDEESIDLREAAESRWCSWKDLGAAEIAEDIRHLGRQAIEAVRAAHS